MAHHFVLPITDGSLDLGLGAGVLCRVRRPPPQAGRPQGDWRKDEPAPQSSRRTCPAADLTAYASANGDAYDLLESVPAEGPAWCAFVLQTHADNLLASGSAPGFWDQGAYHDARIDYDLAGHGSSVRERHPPAPHGRRPALPCGPGSAASRRAEGDAPRSSPASLRIAFSSAGCCAARGRGKGWGTTTSRW